MDLGNPVEIVTHYLLIRGIVCLGHQDKVFMISALMRMITHWTRSMMNHDVRLQDSHDSQDTMSHGFSTLR